MKKLIASILTVLTIGASAQLTYVTTLDSDEISAPMLGDDNGIDNFIDNNKYLISKGPFADYYETIREYYDILNSDFSLHKRITIDTIGWTALGLSLDDIFFSDHLFNSDDKVEIIYSIEKREYYIDEYVDGDYKDVDFKTVVIDEDGIELQIIDNIDVDNIFQLNGKTYLKGNSSDEEDKIVIYEAGGNMPCKSCSSSEATSNKKAPVKAYDINVFPNPTTNQITLAINTDKTGMKVHIYSTDGKLVKSASVVNGNNLIDTADLVSGTYIYNVQTDTEVIHASQFVKK